MELPILLKMDFCVFSLPTKDLEWMNGRQESGISPISKWLPTRLASLLFAMDLSSVRMRKMI